MAPSARRLLVTLLIPALYLAAQQLLLVPGLHRAALVQLYRATSDAHAPGAWLDRTPYSALGLGLAPVLAAFVTVECLALLVPAWRRLRSGTPAQRRSLQRSAIALTFAFALVQAWFLALYFTAGQPRFLHLFEDSLTTRVLITATLIGGLAVTLLLAALLDRFGLGNGFSILLLTPLIPAALKLGAFVRLHEARDLLWLAVALLAVIAGTRWILQAHRRAATPGPSVIRPPTSGLVPITAGASLLALYASWSPPDLLAPGRPLYYVVLAALTIGGAVILTRLYLPPAKLAASWRRLATAQPSPPPDAELAQSLSSALVRTLVFLVALGAVLPWLMTAKHGAPPLDLFLVALATAVALDLLAEWRARRAHGELVAVWPLHQVALLELALASLAAADIPVHPRAAHHRALLWFFGPYVPIELMVPAARAAEASVRLSAILLPPPAMMSANSP